MTLLARPSPWKIGLILAVGVLSVSAAAIFIRLAFQAAGESGVGFSLVLAASRLTIASLILSPTWRNFGRNFKRNSGQNSGQNSVGLQPSRRSYTLSIAAGVFLAIHFATWITSLSFTSIAASATLVTTNPVWVALLSWLWLKEKPSRMTIAGIVITLLGSGLVALGGDSITAGSNPLLGNSLALVGSWAVSLYFLLGREAQRQGLTIGNHLVLTYTTAALVLLPLPLMFGAGYTGYASAVYGYILLIALFPQLIGHSSLNWAVRWVSPTLVTLTILAEPVGSSLLGAIVFRENPGWTVIFGAIVILSGVAIAALGSRSDSLQ
ncbi:DMT family transporter [Leptolyngbya ohadii]|uniref:DMT family transporter n=1 Tax=Leptolyngbya ohadii TaxID=1962290 RepID=UPI000B59B6ED|nr:DMT family transporter [Leptolyngbya ohadii]